MRAVTSEFVAAILAVFTPANALAQRALEVPMVAIEGGSYPIGSADATASARPPHMDARKTGPTPWRKPTGRRAWFKSPRNALQKGDPYVRSRSLYGEI